MSRESIKQVPALFFASKCEDNGVCLEQKFTGEKTNEIPAAQDDEPEKHNRDCRCHELTEGHCESNHIGTSNANESTHPDMMQGVIFPDFVYVLNIKVPARSWFSNHHAHHHLPIMLLAGNCIGQKLHSDAEKVLHINISNYDPECVICRNAVGKFQIPAQPCFLFLCKALNFCPFIYGLKTIMSSFS